MSVINLDLQSQGVSQLQELNGKVESLSATVQELNGKVEIADPTERQAYLLDAAGANLFNKDTATDGMGLNANGIAVEWANYCLSDYIPVSRAAGASIYSRYGRRLASYNSRKEVIACVDTKLLALTEDTCFVRVCVQLESTYTNGSGETVTVNNKDAEMTGYGSVFTEFKAYDAAKSYPVRIERAPKILTEGISAEPADGNLFDRSTATLGYALGSGGTPSALAGYYLSGFIAVSRNVYPALRFLARNYSSAAGLYRLCFYDRDHWPIKASFQQTIAAGTEIEIPAEACWLRVSGTYHSTNGYDLILKYADRPLSWFDLGTYKPLGGCNLMPERMIKNMRIGTSGEIGIAYGCACTPPIPVKPDTRYLIQARPASNNYTLLFEYDEHMEPLNGGGIDYTIGYRTSSACRYVAFNYRFDASAVSPYQSAPFYLIEASAWSGEFGVKIADKAEAACYGSAGVPLGGRLLSGIYGNHVVVQNYSSGSFYYSESGWAGDFVEVPFNSETFPGLTAATCTKTIFFETSAGVRCLVFFKNNQIYCSTTGAFAGFEVPDIWDLPGRCHWRVDPADTDPTGQRKRMYLPADTGSRQNLFDWHNGPVWLAGIGGQYSRGLCFGNYTNAHATNPTASCLFYTEDGKNIYAEYGFGVYQKYYKKAGDETEYTAVNYGLGDDVDCSGFGSYGGGLELRVRHCILPSSAQPDPTDIFEYSEAVIVSAVSGKTFTLADAAGVRVGDVVVLSGSASGDYAKLVNSTASSTDGGSTAFVVKSKNGNNIELADAVGNVANNLMCRHIHGVSEFGAGICVYTGEEYPESWFIYIGPRVSQIADNVNPVDASWQNTAVRLNAAENAHQRSLGVYLRSDGKMISIADSNRPYTNKLAVRGKGLQMGNYGIHVFDLADIDDSSKSISRYPAVNAGYALYRLGHILFYSDYYGVTLYSGDEGDSWKYLCTDGTQKNQLIGWDRDKTRFYFNTTRAGQFVLQLK